MLTSAGIKNTGCTTRVDLLGEPIAECRALCIHTAAYANPGGAAIAWRLICGQGATPHNRPADSSIT
jgi:dipeptidase E